MVAVGGGGCSLCLLRSHPPPPTRLPLAPHTAALGCFPLEPPPPPPRPPGQELLGPCLRLGHWQVLQPGPHLVVKWLCKTSHHGVTKWGGMKFFWAPPIPCPLEGETRPSPKCS